MPTIFELPFTLTLLNECKKQAAVLKFKIDPLG